MVSALADAPGRVAVVTGATSGIGFATARLLSGQGFRVVVNARTRDDVEKTTLQLSEAGSTVSGWAGDVSSRTGATQLITHAVRTFGGIDILINNAARACVVDGLELDEAEWHDVLDVNLSGPMWTAQAAARSMRERGGGVIVNLASVFGMTANSHRAAYIASKHGLLGLTQALAVEWAEFGIRTCAVSPSFIETRMVRRTLDEGRLDLESIRRRTPMGRLGNAEEVASVIAFLVSDGATFINGVNIPVDGGWLINGDV
jgi:3-oxoacyl-[acyl-carrier protein] reductase